MKLREGLGSINASVSNPTFNSNFSFGIGKVFGTLLSENNLSKDLWDKYNGEIGTVFYQEYENSKNIDKVDLKLCSVAKPLFPFIKYYPLNGELILILSLPSSDSQTSPIGTEKYYISPINIWNNPHYNSLTDQDLGNQFKSNSNINNLNVNEGDLIFEGRFGNGVRIGSNDNSPLIVIGNGYNFNSSSLEPYNEDINNDKSSLWISENKTINLTPGVSILSSIISPKDFKDYSSSQLIFNSNRVVINSKKDDILITSGNDIGIFSNSNLDLFSKEKLILNSKKIHIGANKNNLAYEPVLLGNKTIELLIGVFQELASFSNKLSSAISSPEGTPITQINSAAVSLSEKMVKALEGIEKIKSSTVYTI